MCLEVSLISRYDWHFMKNDCEVDVLEMSSKCFQSVYSLFAWWRKSRTDGKREQEWLKKYRLVT